LKLNVFQNFENLTELFVPYDSRDGTATSAGIGRRISDGARGGGRLVPSRFQSVVTALAIAQQHIKTAARLQEDF
jgi:hypothetical protein